VRVRALLDRLPIRLRLTLAFVVVMTLLLAAIGTFVYVHFKSGLDASIRQELQARGSDLVTLARQPGALRTPLPERKGSFAQVLDSGGRVVATTPQAGRRPLLSRGELAQARGRQVVIERHEQTRLLARPLRSARPLVVVVGVSLAPRERALETLGGALLIGGPLALLLASGAGYMVAAGALGAVESMRRRAATISASDVGARLPVPLAQDEVRRLGETLNGMLERVEAGVARERAFVADASHELRRPLSVLKLELELALSGEPSSGELERAVRSATEEVDRLARLSEDLLVMARVDRGRLPVRRERIDLRWLMDGVAGRFAGQAQAAGRVVRVEDTGRLRVQADPGQLEQALGNLVDNALRYGEGLVVLRASAGNGRVEVHVLDQGRGFPPDFLPRAFERFARADRARSSGGSGLGLAIVQAIAHAHGGDAHVANQLSGGAHVRLSLPQR
jgi:signal transduction histidine kinase